MDNIKYYKNQIIIDDDIKAEIESPPDECTLVEFDEVITIFILFPLYILLHILNIKAFPLRPPIDDQEKRISAIFVSI